MGNTPSIPLPQRDRHESSEPTPISVPRHTSSNAGGHSHSQPRPAGDSIHQRQHQQYSHTLPNTEYAPPLSGPNAEYSYAAQSNLHFPPRLPLPIEEEDYVPGSPIISPDEVQESLLPYDLDPENPNRGSILSSTTLDDDEVEEYPSYSGRKTVPTVFKWEEGGERVYVTGTFTEWTKKYRMMKNPETGIFTVTIDLPPGTHHARFLVDGEMQLSEGLPTAVDFNGILINYFEVNADDIVVEQAIADQAGESQVAPDPEGEESTAPPGVDAKDHEPAAVPGPSEDQRKEKEKEKAASPEEKDVYYGNVIPEYLLDLDRDENTNRYRRAAGAVDDLQNPPSLPLFLGKSILNGSSSVKDDASVLTIPNHTVLNHLSTSSIRNDILATAVTTRYKQKFLTTITYRPTSLE
ncbi:hypothetical protein MMC25_001172 [Agyrium rufum]|nr:hypothetical protein [Agyrium rufum]